MNPMSKVLFVSVCALAFATAPSYAQNDGPSPDANVSSRGSSPGTPQDGPDGAPSPGGQGRWDGGAANHHSAVGAWGRGGPSPEAVAKMHKVEELDGKLSLLIQKNHTASEKDKAAVKAEMRKTVADLFDAQLALAEEAQKSHEKRAAELKVRIAKRKTLREALIDKRLSQALGEEEDDDWD